MTNSDLFAAILFYRAIKARKQAEGPATDQYFNHMLYGALARQPFDRLSHQQQGYLLACRKAMLAARTGIDRNAPEAEAHELEQEMLAAHKRAFDIDFGPDEPDVLAVAPKFKEHIQKVCSSMDAAASYCKAEFGDPWLGRDYVVSLYWPCEIVALAYVEGLHS